MKQIILIASALLAASVCQLDASLVVNGSFEDPIDQIDASNQTLTDADAGKWIFRSNKAVRADVSVGNGTFTEVDGQTGDFSLVTRENNAHGFGQLIIQDVNIGDTITFSFDHSIVDLFNAGEPGSVTLIGASSLGDGTINGIDLDVRQDETAPFNEIGTNPFDTLISEVLSQSVYENDLDPAFVTFEQSIVATADYEYLAFALYFETNDDTSTTNFSVFDNISLEVTAVPEPSSVIILSLLGLGLIFLRYRSREFGSNPAPRGSN